MQPAQITSVASMSKAVGTSPNMQGAWTMLMISEDAASGASNDCAANPTAAKSLIAPIARNTYPSHHIGSLNQGFRGAGSCPPLVPAATAAASAVATASSHACSCQLKASFCSCVPNVIETDPASVMLTPTTHSKLFGAQNLLRASSVPLIASARMSE